VRRELSNNEIVRLLDAAENGAGPRTIPLTPSRRVSEGPLANAPAWASGITQADSLTEHTYAIPKN
jgi:hypothetical protein